MKVLTFPTKPAVATMPKSALTLLNTLRQRNPSLTEEVFQIFCNVLAREAVTSKVQQMVDGEWIVGSSAFEQLEIAINDYVTCTLETAIESVQSRPVA